MSTSVSRTVLRSTEERLMILSTSAVAVCCCSDSVRSRVLACTSLEQPDVADRDHGLIGERSAASAICLSLNGCTSMRRSEIAPMLSPSRSNGTLRTVR